MKETKALLKNIEDPESHEQVAINVEYLAILAQNGATANKIVKEGGVDLALNVLKKVSAGPVDEDSLK